MLFMSLIRRPGPTAHSFAVLFISWAPLFSSPIRRERVVVITSDNLSRPRPAMPPAHCGAAPTSIPERAPSSSLPLSPSLARGSRLPRLAPSFLQRSLSCLSSPSLFRHQHKSGIPSRLTIGRISTAHSSLQASSKITNGLGQTLCTIRTPKDAPFINALRKSRISAWAWGIHRSYTKRHFWLCYVNVDQPMFLCHLCSKRGRERDARQSAPARACFAMPQSHSVFFSPCVIRSSRPRHNPA